MQRFVEIKPPYGTALILQPDGSAWLVWDDSFTRHREIGNWLRSMVEKHESSQDATVEVLSITPYLVEEKPQNENDGVPKEKPHDWEDGTYLLGRKCKACGVVASGVESEHCT